MFAKAKQFFKDHTVAIGVVTTAVVAAAVGAAVILTGKSPAGE